MLVASNETCDHNLAWATEKSQGPFFCPSCKKDVILRKGKIRVHHFAHKPPISCVYGTGESQQHLLVKRQIYESLVNHPRCSKCALERPLHKVRPDISLYVDSTPIAIEIQKSVIGIDEIERRTKEYATLGIYLLWILPDRYPATFFHNDESVHRIKEWEKYIHALYFGRLYYWQSGALIRPYHFDSVDVWVEHAEWYVSGGDMVGVGGYWRTLKTLKTVVPNKVAHIVNDFRSTIRNEWSSKNWSLPRSKIWIDKFKKWW